MKHTIFNMQLTNMPKMYHAFFASFPQNILQILIHNVYIFYIPVLKEQ